MSTPSILSHVFLSCPACLTIACCQEMEAETLIATKRISAPPKKQWDIFGGLEIGVGSLSWTAWAISPKFKKAYLVERAAFHMPPHRMHQGWEPILALIGKTRRTGMSISAAAEGRLPTPPANVWAIANSTKWKANGRLKDTGAPIALVHKIGILSLIGRARHRAAHGTVIGLNDSAPDLFLASEVADEDFIRSLCSGWLTMSRSKQNGAAPVWMQDLDADDRWLESTALAFAAFLIPHFIEGETP